MISKILNISFLMLVMAIFVACHHDSHHHHDHDDVSHAEEHHHDEIKSANGVIFDEDMRWGIEFATAPVELVSLGNVIRTVAQVQPAQGDEVILTSKVDGVVASLSSQWAEGTAINAGQSLCHIDASTSANSNLKTQQQQAQAELDRAQAELDRMESLRADQLVLESELQQARATYQQAKATWQALHQGYGQGTQSVVAPYSGFLQQILVSNGQHVSTGDVIAILSKFQGLQLKAEVPVRYYGDLSKLSGAVIHSMHSDQIWTLEELDGRVLGFGRQTSAQSPLLSVTIQVSPADGLVPGAMVDVWLKTQSDEPKLCIPSGAVMEEMGHYFVYVQLHEDYFEKRQIHIGASDGLMTEVKSGLKSGEVVVSKGAVMIKLQQSAGNVDPHSGHSH